MRRLISLVLALSVGGCTAAAPSGEADEGVVDGAFETGKADDYLSSHGLEFDATTTFTIQLGPNDTLLDAAAQLSRARELAADEMDRITRALDKALWERWPEAQREGDTSIVVRMVSDSIEELVDRGGGAFEGNYRVNVAGPLDILDRFPFEQVEDRRELTVMVEGRTYTLLFEPTPATPDAYPDYEQLFRGRDGLDIAIHIGDDHYEAAPAAGSVARDLAQARALYAFITEKLGFHLDANGARQPGLAPPVGVRDFDGLGLRSGGFTGFIYVENETWIEQVPVRISLYQADMVSDDRLDELVEAYEESARIADVVIYTGHAGQNPAFSGVVVHYPDTGTNGPLRRSITANRFAELELPSKYQIFMFHGCGTYARYPDKLFENPNKTTENLDVISTINYSTVTSDAGSVQAFLTKLLDRSGAVLYPRSYREILQHVNEAEAQLRYRAIVGVHGLSDNPRITPLARLSTIGRECRNNDECRGADNFCVRRPVGLVDRVGKGDETAPGTETIATCGVACTDTSGCPRGSRCLSFDSERQGRLRQCLSDTEIPW